MVPARPVEAVGPRVQPRREDHHLPDPGGDGVGEVLVEEVGPHRLVAAHVLDPGGGFLIDGFDLGHDVRVEHGFPQDVGTGVVDEQPGVGIADQRVGLLGLDGPGGGHHDRGGADAALDVPGVVVGAQ